MKYIILLLWIPQIIFMEIAFYPPFESLTIPEGRMQTVGDISMSLHRVNNLLRLSANTLD